MALTIPNEADASYARQSVPMSGDFDALIAAFNGNGVIEGCVTSAGTGLSASVAAGTRGVGSRWSAVSAAANQTITAADGTNPRIDAVVVATGGSVAIRTGVAAAQPVPPALTAGDILLAYAYVPASAASIVAGNLVDKRAILVPSGVIYVAGAQTAFTTPAATNSNAFTGVTIPANYLAAGQHLRVRAIFTETTVTSPGNLTFRVKLGTNIIATTGAVARTASQTSRPIILELDIYVVDTTHVEANGVVRYNTSATAVASWPLGASAGAANIATVVITSNTAQALTIDVTTTVTTATLTPRLMTVEMF